ncbi:sensor histidine kinase [Sporolactobacillus sp. STCC-11]|uniref:sensor histidine kinase n=1 Tax=Sporolactobacillus caesalpiniae TaxID=3230362 RepID=UPI003394C144
MKGSVGVKLFPKSTGPYPYLWILIIFPQYFINALQDDNLTSKVTALITGIILIYVFRQMYWLGYLALLLHFLLGIAALTAVSIVVDPSMMFYAIGLVFLFGYIEQVRNLVIGSVGLIIAYLIVALVVNGDPLAFDNPYQVVFLLVEAVIPTAVFMHERTKNLHHQLDHANEQIVTLVKEQERDRLARDLHDTLGHTLTMIVLKSELALRLIDQDRDKVRREIGEIEQITRSALRQTREIVSSNRHHSLTEELNESKRFLEMKGISVTICSPETWPQLQSSDETMLSLALREGITNVARHSAAEHCRIYARVEYPKLVLEVKDDGVGIGKELSGGSGMHTMRERMQLVGGTVDFLTEESGTTLCFSLPLNEKKAGVGL